MAEAKADDEAGGAAIAALALAQIMFWQLLQKGTIEKAGSIDMLKRAVEINSAKEDPAHAVAAEHLTKLLHVVEPYRPPLRQHEPPTGE
jgi:hypothetical protein